MFSPLVHLSTYYILGVGIVKNRTETKEGYPLDKGPSDLPYEYVRLLSAKKIGKPAPNWLEQ